MAAKKSYHKGITRAELTRAAQKILAEKGWESVNVTNVAKAVGVSPPNFYNHFSGKEELLAAIVTDGYRQLKKKFDTLNKKEKNHRKLFRSLCQTYIKFAIEKPALYRVMFGHEIKKIDKYPELDDAENTLFAYSLAVGEGKAFDATRPLTDYPFALTIWALLHGYAKLIADGHILVKSQSDIQKLVEQVLDIVLPKQKDTV